MAQENPTWGQARVSAELSVKLGIYVSSRTVSAYWPPEPGARRTSSQNWRTFVRNHAQSVVACDFLVVVTARFRTLYVFLLMEVGTRRIVHGNVTTHPTAACYRFLIHDRLSNDRMTDECSAGAPSGNGRPRARAGAQHQAPRPTLFVDFGEQNPFNLSCVGG
jgi:hypothetical protein